MQSALSRMRVFFIFVLSVGSLGLFPGAAEASNSNVQLFLGAGLVSQNLNQLTTSADQSNTLVSNLYSQVSVFSIIRTGTTISLIPRFMITPFGLSSSDGGTKSSLFAFGLAPSLSLSPGNTGVDLRTGPGILLYRVGGKGGDTTLDNGLSRSTFSFPDNSNTSQLFYWDIGLGLQSDRFRIDLDAWITSALSSARRAVTGLATVSYAFF